MIFENISLKRYNTFGIDVNAKYFAEFSSIETLKELLSNVEIRNQPKLILGGGSNILFTKNFNGIVLKNSLKGIELIGEDSTFYYLKSAAGEVWNDFVNYCVSKNYAGLENLSLIPGNVGASPMQNIGAYGVEIKDCFWELEALNLDDKKLITFSKEECKFGYRESVFKNELKNQFIITSVTFRLKKIPEFNISYGAIEKELQTMGIKKLSITSISKAVCNIRTSKLPNPTVIGNAGSFFKNPEISATVFRDLKFKFPNIISYSLGNGNAKLAAGWLIEQSGWKGKVFGNVGVHKLQALVLVNYGGAKGQEVFDLSERIIESVLSNFGVLLERSKYYLVISL